MSFLAEARSFLLRLLQALVGPSRVVLGMIAFLVGFLVTAAGILLALFGAGMEVQAYLGTVAAPSLIELLAAAAYGAWVGALIAVIGLALLWVSRRLDPNGPVQVSQASTRRHARARASARSTR